ncbi:MULTISPECIES: ATP-binding protein [unclassified Desulfovibrio]|uniref:ATP-binding protein n=1 Tax=unclassified Desulfovibrio TaxID=2593640 RepID=UPI0013E9AF9D|nr:MULTISPECIES: ATP-binding protein [unclassified Desulfovibrio]
MSPKNNSFSRVDFEYAEEQISRPEVYKQPILPLYEAIYNAIHSSAEASCDKIVVEVEIIRDESALLKEVSRIAEIHISDYGIGFNDGKTDAFYKLFTTNKKTKFNSKGVGRLTYFSAFNKVRIESCFEHDNKKFRRDFVATLSALGSGELPVASDCGHDLRKTTVRLFELRPEMKDKFFIDFENLKSNIEDQFSPEILTSDNIEIIIKDGAYEAKINRQNFPKSQQSSFNLCGYHFDIYYLQDSRKFAQNNEIWLAASLRIVKKRPLNFLSSRKLLDPDGDSFNLKAIVISDFLNQRVNSTRTDFTGIPDKDEYPNEISYESLFRAINREARNYVIKLIPNIENSNKEFTKSLLQKLPHLAFVIENDDINNNIPFQSSQEKIQDYYVGEFAKKQVEAVNYVQRITKKYEKTGIPNFKEFLESESQKIEEGSKLNHAYLATYVQYREFIIDLFSKFLEPNSDGKCPAESVIHELLFPMRVESKDARNDYDNHNLWIIEDRYSYYSHLTSDQYENKILKRKHEKGDKRYDILEVFNEGYPYQNIFIIELKKYDANLSQINDPVRQIIDYALRLINGEISDDKGLKIGTMPNTCYQGMVICNTNDPYFQNTLKEVQH